ncbi:NAD(P)-dependent oxidoreductase [Anaerocolumna sp. MB42-C2]|uniref:NAD(P)-dependent oxidoreductase n=1 Tax=Anaerocolumna sp. MB42-C2 TaxID=3070997 RepID=UPI0027E196A5|nr:NAD(P)-dependent oxidoreductase [Anaerocolumna sp. MB42-C2]WMJ89064.1 NAD(P)-dependent oxidoreductase [Anaerocolumna sp. MB42-C2]
MRVLLFYVNQDETEYILECNRKFRFDLKMADFDFNSSDSDKFTGYDAVWITTNCKVTQLKTEQLKKAGVRYIVSRAAGTDHMDLAAMKENSIKGANVPRYSPNAIAEHTLCMVLMCLRKMKLELTMIKNYDFTLTGLKGRELRNMTVGVVGTGRIGTETIKLLSGFGCRILAYDLYANQSVTNLVTYSELDDIFSESDILILHCPLTEENRRFINHDTINRMKHGAVLINTARGGLMDYEAVLNAIEVGKISAAAFDVYDSETAYIRKKVDRDKFISETLKKLMEYENVIYTAHMSFYTDTAIENMIKTTFENLEEYENKGFCSNDII